MSPGRNVHGCSDRQAYVSLESIELIAYHCLQIVRFEGMSAYGSSNLASRDAFWSVFA